MSYEQRVVQYVKDLCINGTFISGAVTGLHEDLGTAEAKVMVEIADSISEKYIIIYTVNSSFNWKYLNIMNNYQKYKQTTGDWEYPQLSKRIVAPISLLLQYPQFEVWFRMNNLPISNVNGILYCYCTEILPEHQTLVNSLNNIITIENKPV